MRAPLILKYRPADHIGPRGPDRGLVMGLRRAARRMFRDLGIAVPDSLLREDEPFMRRVASGLSREDVVLDLGAHLGKASIEFSHHAGVVHAFEPHPDIYAQLCHNVRRYPRIRPVNMAASDKTGRARLFVESHGGKPFEGATLIDGKSNVTYETAVDVETVALGDFVLGLGRDVALIKMDIEGAEYRVIAALIETLAMARIGKIWVEDHCDRVAGLAAERDRVLARIEALGLGGKFDFGWP